MLKLQYVYVLVSAFCINVTAPLECFNCSNTNSVNSCAATTTCPGGQSCYLEFSDLAGYRLGCVENQKCGAPSHISSSVFGRDVPAGQDLSAERDAESTKRGIVDREAQHCFECCSFDICNKHLCDHLKPTACIDDSKVDCAWLNSRFNICQSIHDAKYVCPKFCGLCSLVDGNWADWSAWSKCDVTCENGTQIRSRQCNNPAPADGGLTCFGNATEQQSCNLSTCPIDGIWNNWSSWSTCNVTCNDGTQTRFRTCTNPAPAFNGKDCAEYSLEYKQCMNDFCPIDGGWTSWMPWESCSATCDIGIKRRHRNCTNPLPQHYGKFCFGDRTDFTLCWNAPCANGGWSAWGSWSKCNMSSHFNIVTRNRTCTNPRPSILGEQCQGEAFQGSYCGNFTRPLVSAFSVDHPSLSSNLSFSHTIYQQGTDFNPSTGRFTCSISGTYLFSVNLVKLRNIVSRIDQVYCNLFKNGILLSRVHVDPKDDASADSGNTAVSSTVVTSLTRGDIVYLGDCSTGMEPSTVFTGVLLYPAS